MLLVCTGNQCRSPLAAALLEDRLARRGCALTVGSAGLTSEGVAAPPEVGEVLAAVGLDIGDHRSRRVTSQLLADAALVVTMTRQQLVELSAAAPDEWSHCFTLRELVARGEAVGPRALGVELAEWRSSVHAGRTRPGLLALDRADDIGDPMGRRLSAFVRTRDEISGLVDRLAGLLCPAAPV